MFSIISPPPARYLKKCKYKMNTVDVEKKRGEARVVCLQKKYPYYLIAYLFFS